MQLIATKMGILSSLQEIGKFAVFFLCETFLVQHGQQISLLFQVRLNLRQVNHPCLFRVFITTLAFLISTL